MRLTLKTGLEATGEGTVCRLFSVRTPGQLSLWTGSVGILHPFITPKLSPPWEGIIVLRGEGSGPLEPAARGALTELTTVLRIP